MTDLILTTFNWVPEMPRGYMRDIRVRWALEEAGCPIMSKACPFAVVMPSADKSAPTTNLHKLFHAHSLTDNALISSLPSKPYLEVIDIG